MSYGTFIATVSGKNHGYAFQVVTDGVFAEIRFVGQGDIIRAATTFTTDELDAVILALQAARKSLPPTTSAPRPTQD